ncbi:MAG: N-acetylneuraminate synthase family protein [Gallionella sp.]|nr:N-acetylneuraminate synthase family protein [Gallionella sp.]
MKLCDLITHYCPDHYTVRRPFIIAEAGVNHEGDMNIARRLIDEAKEGGADAIKFQTYKAETIASKDSPSYWDLSKEPTDSQYRLFKKYDKFWKSEYEALKLHCDETGIEFLSTPFDVESAKFLNDLMGVFKISSSDLNNKPFIQFLCGFGKPIVLSTGAAYMYEVEEAVSWIQDIGNPVALLHCVLNYPTDDANANLAMIQTLRRRYSELPIGYSDHTLPKDMQTLEVATLLGATIIEKHFTHDKTLPGNDHYHAMDKEDLKRFHRRMDELFTLLGDPRKRPLKSEQLSRDNARRSLVAICDIPEGAVIKTEHLTWKRPAHGINPRDIEKVIGRVSARAIKEDEVLKWRMLA